MDSSEYVENKKIARAACRLWAVIERSVFEEFEEEEVDRLFGEYAALCRDDRFRDLLLLCESD